MTYVLDGRKTQQVKQTCIVKGCDILDSGDFKNKKHFKKCEVI